MNAHLISPQRCRLAVRAVLPAAGQSAVIGAIAGALMFVVTNELHWLYAVPICALIGASVRRDRPHVLWKQRAL